MRYISTYSTRPVKTLFRRKYFRRQLSLRVVILPNIYKILQLGKNPKNGRQDVGVEVTMYLPK
jgi:hypothetical protein